MDQQPPTVVIGAAQQPGVAPQPALMGQPAVMTPHTAMVGQPMYAGVPQTSATIALVLSILSVFCGGCFLSIPGIIMANNALKITKTYPGHPDEGTAKAALVIAWIITGLSIVGIIFYAVLIGALAASGEL